MVSLSTVSRSPCRAFLQCQQLTVCGALWTKNGVFTGSHQSQRARTLFFPTSVRSAATDYVVLDAFSGLSFICFAWFHLHLLNSSG
ncbi:unnamed protein product [Ectocarpus sp. 8 AP-2014]